MILLNLIALIDGNETIHVISEDKTIFFGNVLKALCELQGSDYADYIVNYIYSGFGGICIEIRPNE